MTISTSDYAYLSAKVYDPQTEGTFLPVSLDNIIYKVIKVVNDPSGYYGVVYQNDKTSEIVVAHRGTEIPGDLIRDLFITDGQMALLGVNQQINAAKYLVEFALNYARTAGIGESPVPVTVTGHSLGGALAQITAFDFGLNGQTFNAYGAAGIDDTPAGGMQVINHVRATDLVSAASNHFGSVEIYATDQDNKLFIVPGAMLSQINYFDFLTFQMDVNLADAHKIAQFWGADSIVNPENTNKYENNQIIYDNFRLTTLIAAGKLTSVLPYLATTSPVLTSAYTFLISSNIANELIEFTVGDEVSSSDNRRYLYGNLSDNLISGGLKSDLIFGDAGNDTLRGLGDNDFIYGDDGIDYLDGGQGSDELYGGNGLDRYEFSTADWLAIPGTCDIIDDFDKSGIITINSIQLSVGSRVNDRVWLSSDGQFQLSVAEMSDGKSTLLIHHIATGGSIIVKDWSDGQMGISLTGTVNTPTGILYSEGMDTFGRINSGDTSTSGANIISGQGGNDTLSGGDGDDILNGGNGDDLIAGGNGKDTINGNDGVDIIYGDVVNIELPNGSFNYTTWFNQNVALASNVVASGYGWYTTGTPASGFQTLMTGLYYTTENMPISTFNDVINGGAGDDIIQGYQGNDIIDGGADNDSIIGGFDNDTITGGTGNDRILGDGINHVLGIPANIAGVDTISGGSGDDFIAGNGGNDTLDGGDDNDTIFGDNSEAPLLIAGSDINLQLTGIDNISGGAGNDYIDGGGGNDTIDGGTGNDTIVGDRPDNPRSLDGIDTIYAGDGADTVAGMGGNDIIFGGTGNDSIAGENGVGFLDSEGGDDIIFGESGDDVVNGNGGNDVIDGGLDNDQLYGNSGNDTLIGNAGIDKLYGGSGIDVLDGGDGNDELQGGTENDSLSGGTGNDVLFGEAGEDSLFGGVGDDQLQGGDDKDILSGDDGDDVLFGQNGNDELNGGAGNDELQGGDGNDLLRDMSGQNILYGQNGNDTLITGSSVDYLDGGAGDDWLEGGGSNDTLIGRSGINTYVHNIGDGDDTISSLEGSLASGSVLLFGAGITQANLKLRESYGDLIISVNNGQSSVTIQGFYSSTASNSPISTIKFSDNSILDYAAIKQLALAPTAGNDRIVGFSGADIIQGGLGNDELDGRDGADNLAGGVGNDKLWGGLGNDLLDGGDGDDLISDSPYNQNNGIPSDDVLIGGKGFDQLNGAEGNDLYFYNIGDGWDIIFEKYKLINPTTDTIRFGAGINPADIKLYRNGNDLIIVIKDSPSDQIEIYDYFYTNTYYNEDHKISRIEFNNGAGAVWTSIDIAAAVVLSTADTFTGTASNDNYTVDNTGDNVVEALSGGVDTINSSVDFNLEYSGANVENLTLTGLLNINADGNNLDNVLRGNDANNDFNGRGGNDIAYGGKGNDTYYDIDTAIEYLNEGYDALYTSTGQLLPENFERLVSSSNSSYGVLYAIGNALDNVIEATSVNAILDGGLGADKLIYHGGGGDVKFIVDNVGDTIETRGPSYSLTVETSLTNFTLPDTVGSSTYNYLNSTANAVVIITGNKYKNIINVVSALPGSVISGLDGDDTYIVGDNSTSITIVEAANGGNDTVEYAGGVNGGYLPMGIETLKISDSAYSSTGYGNSGNNTLRANKWGNTLYGLGGNDLLYGGNGNDTLDGGDGNDEMRGGNGSDTYYVNSAQDIVWEMAATGTDQIFSSVSYILPDNIENLTLSGTMQINGTGNSANNVIYGNANANIIAGGLGSDVLRGGSGSDTYTYNIGDGQDFIEEIANTVQDTDVLQLGAGINAADVKVYKSSYGKIWVEVLGTKIDLGNLDSSGKSLIETIRFNDSTTWAIDQIAVLNDPPVATQAIQDQVVMVGSPYSLTLPANLFTTEAWDPLNITISGMPSWLSYDAQSMTFTGTPSNSGNSWVSVIATDTTGLLTYSSFVLGVYGTTINGTAGADTMSATVDMTILNGNAGNDTLSGANWIVRMVGGPGDDTYTIDDGNDSAVELSNEGIDTVKVNFDYTLGSNLENLTLLTGAYEGNGNELNNVITGNSDYNNLRGGAGDDVLDGKAGDDYLFGGLGNDTYIIDSTNDYMYEDDDLVGIDTVKAGFSYTLQNGFENLTLTGTSAINGTGTNVDNILTGNSAANVLTGLGGNDTLNGAAGNDTLIGGLGNDTYVVDAAGDAVTENANEGTDTVQSSVTYTLGANVENLTLTGSSAINATGNAADNILNGNSGANTLSGGGGNDTMAGGGGTDIYVVDSASDVVTEAASAGTDTVQSSVTYTLGSNVENLTLTGASVINGTGNTLANTITGNGANNTLDGGSGNDTLVGGLGNDLYIVDATGDVVTEVASAGTDTIQSTVTYTLGNNVENLTLTGTAAINATGNTLNNVLIGNSGNNTLSGGTGSDTMSGGAGNDTYVVDVAGDVVTENAGEGTDTVQSAITYTLGANLENLTLTGTTAINGTGNTLNNTLTGNSGNNTLNGGTGTDTMAGGLGDDIYVVDVATDVVTEATSAGTDTVQSAVTYTLGSNVENLTLTGSAALSGTGNTLNNTLTGNSGNNTLNGGTGTDTMAGGLGDDIYVVDVATDVVTEAASAGTDTVQSAVTYTLGSNVENLTLTGTAANNGTGNTLNNTLIGNTGTNTLTGGAGNDFLDGGTGTDTMIGGTGNDTFVVNSTGDIVTEAASEGTDTVQSSITYTLAANLENLTLTGTAAINGTGNSANNVLQGNSANNLLTGAAGNDTYVYLLGGGQDTITDTAGTDTLSLGPSILQSDLLFSKVGNDLKITVGSSGGFLTVKEWYTGTTNKVETLLFNDSSTMTSAQIDALVQAMGSFAAPEAMSMGFGAESGRHTEYYPTVLATA